MNPGVLLLISALCLVMAAVVGRRSPSGWLGLVLVAGGAGLLAAGGVLAGAGPWILDSHFEIATQPVRLRLDGVSALFLALLSVLGALGGLYSHAYWADARHPVSAPAGRALWCLMLASMGGVLVCGNGLHFLALWEVFTTSAYFLITLDRQWRDVRAAGWLYLGASHAGTLCLFGFFAALAARTGSWELGPMLDRPELGRWYWLALVGFGLKAGVFPLHVWLPSAHANAPSHVSAMLSGVAIKMGVYGLVRFSGWLPVPMAAAWVLVVLGLGSAVLGVVFALAQHDLKRLLAYHSVENIGIILLGLGFGLVDVLGEGAGWGRLALAGGLLHVWNHGLFKALLFFGAGAVAHAAGTRDMSRLGGLWRRMPWTASCFVVGAAAIAGLPPLNGFVSEWLIYLGLLGGVMTRGAVTWGAAPAVVLLGVTGALALACFVKVCGVVFLGAPRSDHGERGHECAVAMRVPQGVLAALCVGIGLLPWLAWPALAQAMVDWRPGTLDSPLPPPSLFALSRYGMLLVVCGGLGVWVLHRRLVRNGVRRGPTWDCGYAAPTARMQYTAGSFAAIITEWFGWILQPHRRVERPEGLFPVRGHYEVHTPETVLERVVHPLAGGLMRASAGVRRMQHGRVQAYVLYLLLGLAGLALLAILGGGL